MKKVDDVCRTYMKLCKHCNQMKSIENFYGDGSKETRCKSCVSVIRKAKYAENPQRIINRVAKYRNENPEKIRDTKLRQAYGVGTEYFNDKLKEQGGVCDICKRVVKTIWRGKEVRMALDHEHETNRPRGVLCIKCNRALGLLEENKSSVSNMIDYINKYKKVG